MKTAGNKRSRNSSSLLAGLIALVMLVLLALEFLFLVSGNQERAEWTALVMVDQIEGILKSNERKTQALVDSLKENYITKAKAVSYIVDHVEAVETNIEEQRRIAELMSIDEIHLFDEGGTIYSGTVPIYYGYSFDSGEQMGWFKPMLSDKTLAMCQDVTPNTAEGKSMMYAICWSDTGKRMVQVGIEPLRLLEELQTNEINEVIASMPTYDGLDIIAADAQTGVILGASQPGVVGQSLPDLGIGRTGDAKMFQANVAGKPSYCVLKTSGPYSIGILQDIAHVNAGVPTTMLTVFVYLLMAGVILVLVIRRMTTNILNERRNANLDGLTGLENRRAYEAEMARLEKSPELRQLVYVTMDINGLKAINDELGHDAGDTLIRGAARLIADCFGSRGTVYRIGGDEFAALTYMDRDQLEQTLDNLRESARLWTQRNSMELSISCGSARAEELEDITPFALAKASDKRMYAAKAAFYQRGGKDRRRLREN